MTRTEDLKVIISKSLLIMYGAGLNDAQEGVLKPSVPAYDECIRILRTCKDAGLAFVDKDSMHKLLASGAASNDAYWAKDIGMTWERTAPIFESFYEANFRQFEEIELDE